MAVTIDPSAEALERVGGRYAVRVLEPSPPPVTTAPWFADDPVCAPVMDGLPVVSPVANGDVTWDQLATDDAALAPWCADRWLGAWRSLAPVLEVGALVRTRTAWQAVAERVLAPARHRANGKIGLRFTRGGLATPWFDDRGTASQLRVVGTDVLTFRGTECTTTPIPLLEPSDGGDEDLGYTTKSTMTREVLAQVDHASAALLGDWLGLGCSVLEALRFGQPDADATRCQIWPEHLDCSIELGDDASGRRATFGASAGDDAHLEPYLYVMPWSDRPADPFWNDTAFRGASLPYARLVGTPDARNRALEFLRTGLVIATGRPFPT